MSDIDPANAAGTAAVEAALQPELQAAADHAPPLQPAPEPEVAPQPADTRSAGQRFLEELLQFRNDLASSADRLEATLDSIREKKGDAEQAKPDPLVASKPLKVFWPATEALLADLHAQRVRIATLTAELGAQF